MPDLTNLATYGISGIALASIILIAFIVKEFMRHMNSSSNRHQKNYERLDKSIRANTKVTLELYHWLKEKNGKLWSKNEKR